MPPLLEVQDLHAEVDGRRILKGLYLTLEKGEVRAVEGADGDGLARVLMGHPSCKVSSGSIAFLGEDILPLPTHERARRGMFMAFRHPQAVAGVTVATFLRAAMAARFGGETRAKAFRKLLTEKLLLLKLDEAFGLRHIDGSLTDAERDRFEALQLAMLNPALAILDGTESGRDAVGPETGVLVIARSAS